MTPTPELQFVEREILISETMIQGYDRIRKSTVRILQQKWVNEELRSNHADYAAWRDVPVEKEDV